MDQERIRTSLQLSRRDVLVGATLSGLAIAAPAALAGGRTSGRRRNGEQPSSGVAIRRCMAAAAPLSDGRILVTGGYDRPATGDPTRCPLRSAVIVDPATGTITPIAAMNVGRARHAAVALQDGRVAVIGGFAGRPIAAVEVYDPRSDRWELVTSLAQPRCDHMAVATGASVCVLGGMADAPIAGAETLDFDSHAASPLP